MLLRVPLFKLLLFVALVSLFMLRL